MNLTTLSAYIESKQDCKKVSKRISRAIKLYRHAVKDVAHAGEDIAHAKEDALHAVQVCEQVLEDYQLAFSEWSKDLPEDLLDPATPDEIAALTAESSDADDDEEEDEEEDDLEEEEEEEEDEAEQAIEHLEHASKDFIRALEEADKALGDLEKVDNLLIDILEMAIEEGVSIDLTEARRYVAAQAETGERPAGLTVTPAPEAEVHAPVA